MDERQESAREWRAAQRERLKREADERLQQAKEQAQKLKDARQSAAKFWLEGTPPQIAHEIGEYLSGLRDDVSPAAMKWASARSRLAEMKLGRAGVSTRSSTGAGGRKMALAVQAFDGLKQQLIDATRRGDQAATFTLRKKLQGMAANLAARYGNDLEIGFGDWPYVKPRGQQQQSTAPQQAEQMTFNLYTDPPADTVRAYAQRWQMSEEQARKELSGQ